MGDANEALRNWQSLLPMLKPLIKKETQSAVRRKKMDVAVAPSAGKIGVKEPDSATVIMIPCQPACQGVTAGKSVWVEWLYDNFSTAIAVTPGDGMNDVDNYFSLSLISSFPGIPNGNLQQVGRYGQIAVINLAFSMTGALSANTLYYPLTLPLEVKPTGNVLLSAQAHGNNYVTPGIAYISANGDAIALRFPSAIASGAEVDIYGTYLVL